MLGKEVWQDLRHSGCRVIVFSRVLQTANFVNITFVFELKGVFVHDFLSNIVSSSDSTLRLSSTQKLSLMKNTFSDTTTNNDSTNAWE